MWDTGIKSFLEAPVPTGIMQYKILNHFWIQVAVSEVKRPLRNCFGSETVTSF